MANTWKACFATLALCSSAAAFAQTPAAADTTAPTQTFLCKDGTSVQASSAKGACKEHKGIAKKGSTGASSGKTVRTAKTPAPGGGAGKVWVNTGTKVYRCEGDRYYGTTNSGEYMSEADAKAKGMRAAKGSKGCAL